MELNEIYLELEKISNLSEVELIEFEGCFIKVLKSNKIKASDSQKYLILGLFLNTYSINRLNGKFTNHDLKEIFENKLIDLIINDPNTNSLIIILGKILRQEIHHCWLNDEKQKFRHRVLDLFDLIYNKSVLETIKSKIIQELVTTISTPIASLTIDVRGQAADLLLYLLPETKSKEIDAKLIPFIKSLESFKYKGTSNEHLQLFECHDTIDPHPVFPDKPLMEILSESARYKAEERAFIFSLRFLSMLHKTVNIGNSIQAVFDKSQQNFRLIQKSQEAVLSGSKFEEFIKNRLPSFSSSIEDYIVNRHQIIYNGITIHTLCRWLSASFENASIDRRFRNCINNFYRQIFAIGETCNPGLEGRPFFIDHGYSEIGEKLDYPSYVFIPAGAIWGKGAGVDLSCGIAIGGGVNLANKKGRDGAYIGGSWTSTLYHGHSHIGGSSGSSGAESRDKILYFGLTIEDGKRLPWGEFVDAKDHLDGDIFDGIKTYSLTPKST